MCFFCQHYYEKVILVTGFIGLKYFQPISLGRKGDRKKNAVLSRKTHNKRKQKKKQIEII